MKQAKQTYFKILGTTMVIYTIVLFIFVWLANGPLAHLNLRAVGMILPIIPMVIIFPAMIRFLNHSKS